MKIKYSFTLTKRGATVPAQRRNHLAVCTPVPAIPPGYRDLAEMMREWGFTLDYTMMYRWVQTHDKDLEKRTKRQAMPSSDSWRVDETYVKVQFVQGVFELGALHSFLTTPSCDWKQFLATQPPLLQRTDNLLEAQQTENIDNNLITVYNSTIIDRVKALTRTSTRSDGDRERESWAESSRGQKAWKTTWERGPERKRSVWSAGCARYSDRVRSCRWHVPKLGGTAKPLAPIWVRGFCMEDVMAEMTSRERVLTAMRRQAPDRVPFEFSYGAFTPPLMEVFRQKTGAEDPVEYFHFDVVGLGFQEPSRRADYSAYHADLTEGATIDPWGVARVPGSFHHFTRMVHPMASFTTAEEVMNYPFPDYMAGECHRHLDDEVQRWHEKGLAVAGELYCTIFETAWYMRGMENLLTDFTLNPDLARALLDRMTALRCMQARRLVEAGVDVLRLGDDVASQQRALMRPQTWRTWLKPSLASVIQAARDVRSDILIFYHSDGNVTELIPELIEIGIDILNPVQPECMNPAKVKRQYGDQLAFWGTIGTQTTMPFGAPDDVRAEIRDRIATVGKGGGLLLAPSHVLEPDVPWDNILAFVAAIEEYGHYKQDGE